MVGRRDEPIPSRAEARRLVVAVAAALAAALVALLALLLAEAAGVAVRPAFG